MNDSVLEDGIIATVDQLNLFDPPIIQSAIKRSIIVDVGPTSQLSANQDTPIHFRLKSDVHYLDFSKTRLWVKCKIVTAPKPKKKEEEEEKDSGEEEDEEEEEEENLVAPANLTLQSMWSMIDLKVSGKTTSMMCNGCYPYIAMIQTLLKNSASAKSFPLESQMYFHDKGLMDDVTANLGHAQRYNMFEGGKSVTMEGPLMVDFWSNYRYLLCNTPVDITLYRSRPQFLLLDKDATRTHRFVIEDICLKAHFIEVNPGVLAGHAEVLKKPVNAIYPYTQTDCKIFNIAKGQTSFSYSNIFNGMCPQKVVCAMVEAEAFTGNIVKNCFNFQHFNLNEIELNVDGISSPSRPMRLSFDKLGRQAASPYLKMYDCADASTNPLFGNGIDLQGFSNGHTLICFPLNALEGNYLQIESPANITIRGTFKEALKTAVTLIVYGESPTVAEIDQSRNITIH